MADAQQVVDGCDMVFLTVSDDAILPVCRDLRWEPRHRVGPLQRRDRTGRAGSCEVRRRGDRRISSDADVLQIPTSRSRDCAAAPSASRPSPISAVIWNGLRPASDARPLALPAGVRALYHASAYYVGPFLIALLKEGVELWKSFGASEADALRAMMPLLRGTVAAVLDGGLANGMGGCVARGDVGTIVKHLAALDGRFPSSGALYRELALRNVPLGIERGTLARARAAEIEKLLLRSAGQPRSGIMKNKRPGRIAIGPCP